MKKLLCLLLALCLLAGCASKPASPPENTDEPASTAEAAPEAESTPEPKSEPEPEPEPAEPPAQDFEHEPSWDPSAPASDPDPTWEYEPAEVLSTLSAQQRTDLNVFLSNFSELNFLNFKRNSFDAATAVNFAYMHNKINSFGRDKIDVRQWNGESCYSISTADVDACLERFLGVQIDHEGFEMDMHQIGCDGERYYFPAADGEAFNTFSVVKTMVESEPGVYEVTFDVYALDYEVYWDTGLEDKYYAMTPEQAQSSDVLTLWGSGDAVLEDYENSGSATWRLIAYTSSRS